MAAERPPRAVDREAARRGAAGSAGRAGAAVSAWRYGGAAALALDEEWDPDSDALGRARARLAAAWRRGRPQSRAARARWTVAGADVQLRYDRDGRRWPYRKEACYPLGARGAFGRRPRAALRGRRPGAELRRWAWGNPAPSVRHQRKTASASSFSLRVTLTAFRYASALTAPPAPIGVRCTAEGSFRGPPDGRPAGCARSGRRHWPLQLRLPSRTTRRLSGRRPTGRTTRSPRPLRSAGSTASSSTWPSSCSPRPASSAIRPSRSPRTTRCAPVTVMSRSACGRATSPGICAGTGTSTSAASASSTRDGWTGRSSSPT
ncbi:hypothetical protein SCYAM73S_07174 [Streptomyces cyaneofuscatus]